MSKTNKKKKMERLRQKIKLPVETYVEIIEYNFKETQTLRSERVYNRDPSKIKLYLNEIGFRFYDIGTIVLNGHECKTDRFNISPTYYKGKESNLSNSLGKHMKFVDVKLVIRLSDGDQIID